MLSPSQSLQYQKESVERALTCANCGQKLHVLEVHVCEHCCAELMSDPNSSMYEEDDEQFDDIRVIRGVKVPGGRLGIKITELENA